MCRREVVNQQDKVLKETREWGDNLLRERTRLPTSQEGRRTAWVWMQAHLQVGRAGGYKEAWGGRRKMGANAHQASMESVAAQRAPWGRRPQICFKTLGSTWKGRPQNHPVELCCRVGVLEERKSWRYSIGKRVTYWAGHRTRAGGGRNEGSAKGVKAERGRGCRPGNRWGRGNEVG